MRFGKFESEGRQPIGTGNTKETFINPANEERVISVIKQKEDVEKITPRMLRGAFYLTKIASILLPQHVPEIYETKQSTDGQQTIERKLILHTAGQASLQAARQAGGNEEEARRQIVAEMGADMNKVELELERIGFSFNIDSNVGNYSRNEKGNVQYLETFMPWGIDPVEPNTLELLFDREDLTEAIGQLTDDKTRETCESYLKRILTLFEEEKMEFERAHRTLNQM